MKLDKLSRTDMQIGGAALVLAISDLLFPWFSFSFENISVTFSGTSAPDGWLGVLGLIALIALVADLLVERYSPQTAIPPLGGSREMTRLILAGVAGVCLALKFILHVHFSDFGWGFYVDVIATAVLIYSVLEARRGPLT
jgi:hypothetical protein